MVKILIDKESLQEVFDVMDDYLGDTDPHIEEDATDEDIRIEHPAFWCCRQIGLMLQEPTEAR